jgi:hypothetical protein
MNPVVRALLVRLEWLPDDHPHAALLAGLVTRLDAYEEKATLAREPVRTNEDANDGFGPRVLHEQQIAALRAMVPTVKLDDDIPF